jgi:hypothetical protein
MIMLSTTDSTFEAKRGYSYGIRALYYLTIQFVRTVVTANRNLTPFSNIDHNMVDVNKHRSNTVDVNCLTQVATLAQVDTGHCVSMGVKSIINNMGEGMMAIFSLAVLRWLHLCEVTGFFIDFLEYFEVKMADSTPFDSDAARHPDSYYSPDDIQQEPIDVSQLLFRNYEPVGTPLLDDANLAVVLENSYNTQESQEERHEISQFTDSQLTEPSCSQQAAAKKSRVRFS